MWRSRSIRAGRRCWRGSRGSWPSSCERRIASARGTRKAEALLAFLALPIGRAHPRDKLTALLWDDVPRPPARARLRQALFAIRSALEGPDPPPLRLENDTVALDPQAITADVADFERLAAGADCDSWRAAAALYHGDLLAGIAPRETPFESWLLAERERLHERALQTLAKLLDAERRRDDADAAIQAELARGRELAGTETAESHYREALEAADRLGLAPVAAECRSALAALARSA